MVRFVNENYSSWPYYTYLILVIKPNYHQSQLSAEMIPFQQGIVLLDLKEKTNTSQRLFLPNFSHRGLKIDPITFATGSHRYCKHSMVKKELGTVIRRTKGFYYLRNQANETVECKIKGLLFKNSRFDNQVAVGDIVVFQKSDNDNVGLITKIEPRNSFLSRARVGKEAEQVIAANIDYLLIIAATKHPAFRFNLINRMLVAASVGKITPILVITKTDLIRKEEIDRLLAPFYGLELEYFLSTTQKPETDPKLSKILKNGVSVLSGQSGAGKSSLLNKYFPSLSIKIGDVSAKTHKGSHTTTYTISHQIADNGFVIDTPGIREFGLWNITQTNLCEYYPMIQTYQQQCKHRNCRHVHEPHCAVKDDVATKLIHPVLYDGYVSIFNSLPSH